MIRRVILVLGLLAVATMCAFPPWVTAPENHPSATTPAGYHFILRPPPGAAGSPAARANGFYGSERPAVAARFVRIDYALLAVQWVVVAALVGVAMVATSAKAMKGQS
jgi:hypothetical protein